jgi:hypothetical protein
MMALFSAKQAAWSAETGPHAMMQGPCLLWVLAPVYSQSRKMGISGMSAAGMG